jgi:hypothetical protein
VAPLIVPDVPTSISDIAISLSLRVVRALHNVDGALSVKFR